MDEVGESPEDADSDNNKKDDAEDSPLD